MPSNPQPECPLAHNLINKLSTVIGYCDLMLDKAPPDSPLLKHMHQIQSIAKSMATDLAQFQCELVKLRIGDGKKTSMA